MYSVIAAAIMNLTYMARLQPELPCTVYFEEVEWGLLYRAANKTKKMPGKPYTIGEVIHCLGQLGEGRNGLPATACRRSKRFGPGLPLSIPYLPAANGWPNFVGQV